MFGEAACAASDLAARLIADREVAQRKLVAAERDLLRAMRDWHQGNAPDPVRCALRVQHQRDLRAAFDQVLADLVDSD